MSTPSSTPVRKADQVRRACSRTAMTGYHPLQRDHECAAGGERSARRQGTQKRQAARSTLTMSPSHYEAKNEDGKEHRSVISHMSMHIDPGKTVAHGRPLRRRQDHGLYHLIPRFYEVTGGKIQHRRSGHPRRCPVCLAAAPASVWWQQDVFLFTGTIRDNIAYGNLNATRRGNLSLPPRRPTSTTTILSDGGWAMTPTSANAA